MSDYNNTHSNNTNDDLYDDDYITYEETISIFIDKIILQTKNHH